MGNKYWKLYFMFLFVTAGVTLAWYDDEKSFLQSFYSIVSPSLTSWENVDWDNMYDVCQLEGVRCNYLMHVTALDLPARSLSGDLGSLNFTMLRHLEEIYLQDNNFTGNFPYTLLKLPMLKVMVLHGNQLKCPEYEVKFDYTLIQKCDISENYLCEEFPRRIYLPIFLCDEITHRVPNTYQVPDPEFDMTESMKVNISETTSIVHHHDIPLTELLVNEPYSQDVILQINISISRFFEYGAERWDDMVMGEAERFDIVYANQTQWKSTYTFFEGNNGTTIQRFKTYGRLPNGPSIKILYFVVREADEFYLYDYTLQMRGNSFKMLLEIDDWKKNPNNHHYYKTPTATARVTTTDFFGLVMKRGDTSRFGDLEYVFDVSFANLPIQMILQFPPLGAFDYKVNTEARVGLELLPMGNDAAKDAKDTTKSSWVKANPNGRA